MSAATRYGLLLHNPTGGLEGEVFDWSTLTLTRRIGQIGQLTMTLPGTTYPLAYWQRDMQLAVMRSVEGTAPYLEGQTRWFLRRWQNAKTKNSDLTTLTFLDANCLLARRFVLYPANSSQAQKTDQLDDMAKAIVRENYGSLATDTSRDISTWLSVEADMSLLPSDTLAFSWRNVMRVIQDLAAASLGGGTYGAFDVIWDDGIGYQFRGYKDQRGADRRALVEISEDAGNLIDPKITFDYFNEVTHVTALGNGEETARETATAIDADRAAASPYNRHELVVDCRNLQPGDSTGLQAEADRALAAGRGKITLSGRIADVPGSRYGYDYWFGDYVMVKQAGYTLACRVDQVTLTINRQGTELIDVAYSGEVS